MQIKQINSKQTNKRQTLHRNIAKHSLFLFFFCFCLSLWESPTNLMRKCECQYILGVNWGGLRCVLVEMWRHYQVRRKWGASEAHHTHFPAFSILIETWRATNEPDVQVLVLACIGCGLRWVARSFGVQKHVFSHPTTSLLPASSQPKSESVEHVRLFLGGLSGLLSMRHIASNNVQSFIEVWYIMWTPFSAVPPSDSAWGREFF